MSENATTPDAAADLMTAALNGQPTNDAHLFKPSQAGAAAGTPAEPKPATQTPAEPENPIKKLLGVQPDPPPGSQDPADQRKPRVFDGLPEDMHDLFQNMSRKSYEALYPLIKELLPLKDHADKLKTLPDMEKELGELRQSRWADHPNAYQLTEEYQAATEKLSDLNEIEAHFAEQLDAFNAGAKEVELLVIQDGKLTTKKVPVDASTARTLNTEYFAAQAEKSRIKQSLAQLKEQHSGRWSSHKSKLGELKTALFGDYVKVLEKPAKEQLARFPAYFRNSPEAELLANAVAMVTLAGKALQKTATQSQAAALNNNAATQAPPTRDGLQPGAGKSGGPQYSEQEYKLLKAQGMLG